MKKLMIAVAAAAAITGAYAEEVSFGETAQDFEETTSVEGKYDLAEDAQWVTMTPVEGERTKTCEEITVGTYAGDAYAYPETGDAVRNAAFDSGSNTQYLHLDGVSSTLYRTFEENQQSVTTPIGDVGAVDIEDGYVVDTLVKMTAFDEDPTTFEDGTKLAFWLRANDTETNLVVHTTTLDDAGTSIDVTNVVVSAENLNVVPDSWVRVTMKGKAMGDTIGFQLWVDGKQLAYAGDPLIDTVGGYEIEDAELVAKNAENKVFPGLTQNQTLAGVGFNGTGSIDDLVIQEAASEDAPAFTQFAAPAPKINIVDTEITINPSTIDTTVQSKPTVTVAYNDTELTVDTDYEVSDNIVLGTAGDYTITIAGLGNYEGSTNITFTITSAAPAPVLPDPIKGGSKAQQDAYVAWAEKTGVTGTADANADAFAIGVTAADITAVEGNVEEAVENKLNTLITAEMVAKIAAGGLNGSGKLPSSEDFSDLQDEYPNANFTFVESELIESTETAKFYQLKVSCKPAN